MSIVYVYLPEFDVRVVLLLTIIVCLAHPTQTIFW